MIKLKKNSYLKIKLKKIGRQKEDIWHNSIV